MGRALRALLAAALVAPALLLAPVRSVPIAAAATAAPAGPAVNGQLNEPPGMRLLVRFDPAAAPEARARAVASVGGAVDRAIDPLGFVRIVLPGGANDAFGDGDAVAAYLSKDPAVLGAELDATIHLAFTPNDQYYLSDPFVGLGQWGIRKAQVDRAWDTVRGSPNVRVAVVDTGVDAGHPDLSGVLLPGTTFLSQPSAGCPFATNDDNGHGTHVSGIIAAAGNNVTGVAGVAFGARILPIKALDCSGTGTLSDIAQAIIWATDQGARIINISLGSSSDSQTLHSAVQYASNRNVLVVAAAGNCGSVGGTCASLNELNYPAAYSEALGVGATDVDDTRAFFSTAQTYVGIAAPGRKIVSTTPTYDTYLSRNGLTRSYGALSGTSQASPFVAGVAALLLSQDPTLSGRQLIDRLKSTADDLGTPGVDPSFGSGRVNALRAVSAAAPAFGATYDTSGVPRAGVAGAQLAATVRVTNSSSFVWSAAGTNPVRLSAQWTDASGILIGGATLTPLAADVAPGASASVRVVIAAPSAGARTLRFDLMQGAVAFSTKGVAAASVAVTLGAGANGASYASPGSGIVGPMTIATPGTVTIVLINTGTLDWSASGPNPVHVAYHWIGPSGAMVLWDGLRTNLPNDVIPGASVSVPLAVLPPSTPGTYTLRVDLVQEGISWFSGQGVAARDFAVSVTSGLAASYQLGPSTPLVLPGIRITVPVTVRNDGTVTWPAAGANPVHLATHVADMTGNTVMWDGERAALPSDVVPGASVTVPVPVSAPLLAGSYRVRVDLVREGVSWFSGLGVATADQTLIVNPDFRATLLPAGPLVVSRAQHTAVVTVTNSSIVAWSSGGAVSVVLAAHWYDASGVLLVWDGPRTVLTRTVLPGESVTLTVDLGPVPSGAGFVMIDLVADGLRWFGAGAIRPVTLVP